MNNLQKEVIKELKKIVKRLGHSPGRREIPKLARKCVRSFGSFNKAKIKVGLLIKKRICEPLPKRAYKLDKNLVRLVSFLTFDGHLCKKLKMILLISKHKNLLKEYENLIKNKFGITGKYTRGGLGNSFTYWVFNTNLCKFLYSVGVPKGDKMLVSYDIPDWIKKNKNLAREYLKIAFLCDGCKYKIFNKNTERIQINLNKSEELLEHGLNFMNSLKELLRKFYIETTKTYILKGNLRKKDGKITKMMKFNVKPKDNNKFIKEIGWYK